MVKFQLIKLCLITSLLFFVTIPGQGSEKKVFLTSCEYPPFYGSELKNKGVIAEIITRSFKRVGYNTTIKFYPWARALRMAKQGRCDGLFTVWYRKEREEWCIFSDPLPANEVVFYKLKSSVIPFKTYQDLKSYKIGIVRGYYNPPEFKKSDYLNKIEMVDDTENLDALIKHFHDLILIDKQVARYLIHSKFPDWINFLEPMEPVLEKINQHLVIPRLISDYQKKMDDFNQGLRQIKKDGTYKKIMVKHGFMPK